MEPANLNSTMARWAHRRRVSKQSCGQAIHRWVFRGNCAPLRWCLLPVAPSSDAGGRTPPPMELTIVWHYTRNAQKVTNHATSGVRRLLWAWSRVRRTPCTSHHPARHRHPLARARPTTEASVPRCKPHTFAHVIAHGAQRICTTDTAITPRWKSARRVYNVLS